MGYPRKATAAAIADMEEQARLRLTARKVTNQDIADRHHIPLAVVNRWMSRIYQALDGSTRNSRLSWRDGKRIEALKQMNNPESHEVSDVEIERLRSLG